MLPIAGIVPGTGGALPVVSRPAVPVAIAPPNTGDGGLVASRH